MSAADEITQMNTLHRTYLVTLAAAGALGVVYGGEVVFNLDCTLGTILLTFHTTYTSVGANLAHLSALVVAGALNDNAGGIVDKVNDMVGTSLCTKAAANALSGVNLRNTLLGIDADCITGTNLHTVAVAKASEGTVAVAGEAHIRADAGLNSVVNVLSLGRKAGAVAGYVSNLLHNVAGGKTHNFTDFSGNAVTAGDTKAGVIGFTLRERLCISITAGEAAGTAVGTGKAITDCKSALVLLNSKEYRGESKKKSTDYCN